MISELDISNGESITSDIDGGDDYWDFCGYLIKTPIYAISSKGSVYLEIFGIPIYYTSIEGSMDLETWENPSMEKQHSKLLYNHSESYHSEPYKGINNEDKEKLISELDISNGESITSNIDDGDDYWDFFGYLSKNPICAISSKGIVYLEI